jgi:hypothetical protein
LVNCFHLSIPVWTGDIPAPLVDVAPEDRDAGQSGEVWRRKKREAPVTKENGERGYPKYGTKRSQRNKEGLR